MVITGYSGTMYVFIQSTVQYMYIPELIFTTARVVAKKFV